jgi:hypothetical protein
VKATKDLRDVPSFPIKAVEDLDRREGSMSTRRLRLNQGHMIIVCIFWSNWGQTTV